MPIQVPDLHVSNVTKAKGKATVKILSRQDAIHQGIFLVNLDLAFNPTIDAYPGGMLEIEIDLSDSLRGKATATTVEQIGSLGKHTPTMFVTGRCDFKLNHGRPETPSGAATGLWLLIIRNLIKKEHRILSVS